MKIAGGCGSGWCCKAVMDQLYLNLVFSFSPETTGELLKLPPWALILQVHCRFEETGFESCISSTWVKYNMALVLHVKNCHSRLMPCSQEFGKFCFSFVQCWMIGSWGYFCLVPCSIQTQALLPVLNKWGGCSHLQILLRHRVSASCAVSLQCFLCVVNSCVFIARYVYQVFIFKCNFKCLNFLTCTIKKWQLWRQLVLSHTENMIQFSLMMSVKPQGSFVCIAQPRTMP